jgi:hypothetical protein
VCCTTRREWKNAALFDKILPYPVRSSAAPTAPSCQQRCCSARAGMPRTTRTHIESAAATTSSQLTRCKKHTRKSAAKCSFRGMTGISRLFRASIASHSQQHAHHQLSPSRIAIATIMAPKPRRERRQQITANTLEHRPDVGRYMPARSALHRIKAVAVI